MRKNIRRNTLVVFLSFLAFSSESVRADIYDSSRQARITCDNFNLPDLFDISSFLDFNIDIGGCSLGTTGLSSCQEDAIDFKTATDKLMGENYKLFNPKLGCGHTQTSSNNFGTTLTTDQKETILDNEKMGTWAQERYENAIDSKNIDVLSRTAAYVSPKDGSILFSGGATTEETRGIITRDANMAGIFADGAEESMLSDNASSLNIEKCKEERASSSVECSLSENLKLYNKTSDERGRLIDSNSKKNASLIEVSALTKTTITFPTKELSDRYPVEKQNSFTEGSTIKIMTDSLFRARIEAVNNHRKAMSKLIATKSSLNATSKYPEVSQEEAKTITTGNLP